jgi:hypothetical protein
VARTGLWPKFVELNDREVETLTWVARGKTSACGLRAKPLALLEQIWIKID